MLGLLATPLVTLGVAAIAWVIDARSHHDEAARGLEMAGRDIGGFRRDKITDETAKLQSQLPSMPVRIVTDEFTLDTTAGELGVSLDADRTVDRAMRLGHHDAGLLAPLRWAKALIVGRPLTVVTRVDRAKASATIIRLEGDRRTAAVEPSLDATVQRVAVRPGKAGRGISIDDVVARLPGGITSVTAPIEVHTERTATRPSLDDSAVAVLAQRAAEITNAPLTITASGTSTSIDTKQLRPGFSVAATRGKPSLALDPALVVALLAKDTPRSLNPTGVHFDLVNGIPTAVAGHDAKICCGDDAPRLIVAALLDGKKKVDVPPKTVTAAEGVAWAAGLGVKEIVGAFTTKHPCCAPRVSNIHRIADLTRGAFIAPDETFSVNAFVGRRTPEKGFVSAPVIEEGQFSEDFGGGVSQFGTTTFNAAFFAGLDIPEHKAHSIYISRYPFGREATLAYPSVDLKIHNNTPYGIMIWTSYTGTSLTVQLWSTKYIVGAQTASNKTSGCGPVTVTRTRTWLSDLHTATDTFRADYNCNPPKHP